MMVMGHQGLALLKPAVLACNLHNGGNREVIDLALPHGMHARGDATGHHALRVGNVVHVHPVTNHDVEQWPMCCALCRCGAPARSMCYAGRA